MSKGVNSGINRNIVECKVFSMLFASVCTDVLIETLWNVKEDKDSIEENMETGINRNIVECKGS